MTVLIVDDHALFAEALRWSLDEAGVHVVGIATCAQEGVSMAREMRPSLVLMDLHLPDGSGVAAGRSILAEFPSMKLVALTAASDTRLVRDVRQAGFHGFLSKGTPLQVFLQRITYSMKAESPPFITADDRTNHASSGHGRGSLVIEQLTAREREVLALLARGCSSRSMAGALSLSPYTVRTHVQNLLAKLQVHTRLEAAVLATRYGIVGDDAQQVAP